VDFSLGVLDHPRTASFTRRGITIAVIDAPGHGYFIKNTSGTFTVNVTRVALAWFQSHTRRTVGSSWTIAMAPVLVVPGCGVEIGE
jgi:hypothetical protein